MAPQLASLHIPQIKVAEIANEWDLDVVGRTFSDKVPGYRSTSSVFSLPYPLRQAINLKPS